MIKRRGIQLGDINKIGHKFREDPVEPIEESPSSQAFAVTLEEYQI